MKDYKFSIKVSDLLRHPWTTDTLQLHNKFSTILPLIEVPWIQAIVELVWLDNKTVLLTIVSASCTVWSTCDRCGTEFQETLSVSSIIVKCFLEEESSQNSFEWDDIIVISKKDETIDIEHVIVEALVLQKSVKSLCSECQAVSTNDSDDEAETTWVIKRVE